MGTVRIIVTPDDIGRKFYVQVQKRFLFIKYWKTASKHDVLKYAKEMKELIEKGGVEA